MSKSNETTPNVPTLRFPNYSGEWQVSPMGKVCTFSKGYGISKENLSNDGTPCILYGELYTTYKTAIAKSIKSKTSLDSTILFHSKKNDVIIPCSAILESILRQSSFFKTFKSLMILFWTCIRFVKHPMKSLIFNCSVSLGKESGYV